MIRLPSYQEIHLQLPLTQMTMDFIDSSRKAVKNILSREDRRLLLIVGPCSIHDVTAALEFGKRLRELQKEVGSAFLLLMRVYCEKARSTVGWKGLMHDPALDGSCAIDGGIRQTRHLLRELAELQVPVATEFVDPLLAWYHQDLVSWGSIGARTSSSQVHRQLASALPMPIGFKNSLEGAIELTLDAIVAASHPQLHPRLSDSGSLCVEKTRGNGAAHLVHRGTLHGPNYAADSIARSLFLMRERKVRAGIIIDCSHHNSSKIPLQQEAPFFSAIQQTRSDHPDIAGVMLESHLFEGSQSLAHPLKYGISITDPCLDWETTARWIRKGASLVSR